MRQKTIVTFAICLLVETHLCWAAQKLIQPRVLGPSVRKAQLGQFPWHVRLLSYQTGKEKVCSGVLLSDSWILTAAHCIFEHSVHIVGNTISPCSCGYGAQNMLSAQIIKYPNYTEKAKLDYDIALIKTTHPFKLSDTLEPIALPDKNAVVGSGVQATLTGWGRKQTVDAALEFVTMVTIEDQACKRTYSYVADGVICTKGPNSACEGDGGGGLFQYVNKTPVLVGISSFSRHIFCDGPSGFTRITYYRDWIKEVTGL